MPLSEEQKKELKKMNSASFVYGASKMEDEELDSLSAAPEAVMQEENAEQLRSEKLIEMMLVDTESAEKLKEAFPDLYEKARAKEANLNRQAEVSGMDKVKHDFFGSKRKAAKASLADLKSKRDVLENKKAFDYEVAYKEQKKVIANLTKERDCYKSLSERLGSDYLNKCAEFGEVRRALRAYETNWPKLRAIAKYHRHQSNKLHDVNVILLDALREVAIEMDWLRDRIPFYKMPFLRKKLHEWDKYFDSLCNKAEGLDRE